MSQIQFLKSPPKS